MFLRPIIEQTNFVHFRILNGLLSRFVWDVNAMPYACSKWQWPIYCVLLMSRNRNERFYEFLMFVNFGLTGNVTD